jgi:penicillin amidase
VTSPSYRYFIGDIADHGYRARRIAEMIEAAGRKLTLADVEAMQADTLNISAREIRPFLKDLPAKGDAARARDALLAWDNRMDPQSSGAAVYGYFWQALMDEVFKVKVPGALWNADAVLDDNARLMNTIFQIMADPHHPFWDNPTTLDLRESRDDVLVAALEQGVRRGIKAQGSNLSAWRWGRVHTATFRNQTFGNSGVAFIEGIFNRGPVAVGGGMQQVISSDWSPEKPFDVYVISSMRQVIDLSNLSASQAMNTTGESGHAGSRHYDDMIDSWAHVRYHPALWDAAQLEAARTDRLVLEPG